MEENKVIEENNVISNNKQPKNKTKLLVIIIVILGLLVLGLGGFIVYDKFIAKDETKEVVEEKEEKEDSEKETTDENNTDKDEEKSVDEKKDEEVTIANQIKTDDYEYVLNNNKHKVSFIYSYEKINSENYYGYVYKIFVTMALDGKIIEETKTQVGFEENENINKDNLNVVNIDNIKKFKDSHNSKEYMVLGIMYQNGPGTDGIDPIIINENGNIVYKVDLFNGSGIIISDSNKASLFYEEYYVATDGVYYLDSLSRVGEEKPHTNDFCNPEQWGGFDPCVTVQEYKITVENGKAIKTPTETYLAMLAGAAA